MENSEKIEVTLVGQPYSNLVISPNNRVLALTSGTSCELRYSDKKGKAARRAIKHDSNVVAVFFHSNERIVTVTEDGEVSEFEEQEGGFEKLVSRRVTAFPVICAFAQKPQESDDKEKELELWLVVRKSDSKNQTCKHFNVCVTGANGSIENVLEIPSDLRKEQIFIADRVVSYCHGLEINSIILSDNDFSVVKETKYISKNEGKQDVSAVNEFERLSANGNFLVAAISDGRILQWSNLKSAGVSDTHHRIHWNKVGAHVAVTQFGNVLSAGAECVLARHSKGQKEPTFLPRLAAPVIGLVLSNDSSTCALIMEDNSVHTVLLATMAIKSSFSTLEYCPRSLNTVFYSDPLCPRDVVMNGKPGTIQWFDPISIATKSKMHVTLENAIDGNMSYRGICSAFRDVLAVSLTPILAATIEKFVNFDGENHLRFWQRFRNATSAKLVASVSVAKDVVFIATCQTSASSKFVNTIISASISGTISVWDYSEKDVREDLERRRSRQESEIRSVSNIQADGKFVTAHGQHAVLWNVKNMKIIDILSCEDEIQNVEFAADERRLIVSTKKGVVCWDTLCLSVVWKIQQHVGIVVNQVGCFAFDGAHVMHFDAESGRVLETVQFSTIVDDLIVIEQKQQALVYVAKTAKGILCHRPLLIKNSGKPGQRSDPKTPFHELSSTSSSTLKSTQSDQQFVRQPRPESAGLFSGPVHQLPPISFLAPLFIEKSLLPPPVRL